MSSILIIDDDRELCALLADYLAPEGFQVESVHSGDVGVDAALSGNHWFVILDVMLPQLGGFEILRRIRLESTIPVLMLTARGSEIDRILGLEYGADDYLPKPFNPQELVARIRAIQRRVTRDPAADTRQRDVLKVGKVSIDVQARRVHAGGVEVSLTSVEFGLLEELLRNAGAVVTRDRLSMFALGRKLQAYDRSLDMHVSNLRRKISGGDDHDELIQTVRSVGYIYVLPPAKG